MKETNQLSAEEYPHRIYQRLMALEKAWMQDMYRLMAVENLRKKKDDILMAVENLRKKKDDIHKYCEGALLHVTGTSRSTSSTIWGRLMNMQENKHKRREIICDFAQRRNQDHFLMTQFPMDSRSVIGSRALMKETNMFYSRSRYSTHVLERLGKVPTTDKIRQTCRILKPVEESWLILKPVDERLGMLKLVDVNLQPNELCIYSSLTGRIPLRNYLLFIDWSTKENSILDIWDFGMSLDMSLTLLPIVQSQECHTVDRINQYIRCTADKQSAIALYSTKRSRKSAGIWQKQKIDGSTMKNQLDMQGTISLSRTATMELPLQFHIQFPCSFFSITDLYIESEIMCIKIMKEECLTLWLSVVGCQMETCQIADKMRQNPSLVCNAIKEENHNMDSNEKVYKREAEMKIHHDITQEVFREENIESVQTESTDMSVPPENVKLSAAVEYVETEDSQSDQLTEEKETEIDNDYLTDVDETEENVRECLKDTHKLYLENRNQLAVAFHSPNLPCSTGDKCDDEDNLLLKVNSESFCDTAPMISVIDTAIVRKGRSVDKVCSEKELIREVAWLSPDQLPVPKVEVTIRMMKASNQIAKGAAMAMSNQFPALNVILEKMAGGEAVRPNITMRYELLRLCTLRNFPKEDKPYLISIAEAGFYYAGTSDEVICYCCGVRRRNWTHEDNPSKVHSRLTPLCRFLKTNEQVNVAIPRELQVRPERFLVIDGIPDIPGLVAGTRQHPEDVSNDYTPSSGSGARAGSGPITDLTTDRGSGQSVMPTGVESSSQATKGISTASATIAAQIPKHPQYATRANRLASFAGWPETTKQSPEQMSEAGFYFAGFGDCVRCFFCGIGLRHWAEEDNPFVEHARWGKNCVYLRQKKGEEFIKLVDMAVQSNSETSASSGNTSTPPAEKREVTQAEMERLLLTDGPQSVLEMGYQPRIIKAAIESILQARTSGSRSISGQELMEKVLDIEDADRLSRGSGSETTARTSGEISATGSHANGSTVDSRSSSSATGSNTANKSADRKGKPAKSGKKDKKKISLNTDNQNLSGKELREENERLREQSQCIICLDNPICIVFLPCAHLVTCSECAPAMKNCPICRNVIKGTVKTYMQ